MQLLDIKEITGRIILESGLHIGSGDMEMRIGGTDNPIIKHPHTQEPYIPGSSIKGKVRSLLEMHTGLMPKTKGSPLSIKTLAELRNGRQKTGKPETEQEKSCKAILKLFGSGAGNADEKIAGELGPTRVSFADCPIDEEWRKNPANRMAALVEVKSENSINRITGTALNPRFTERVPSGIVFSFCVTLKILDSEPELEDLLFKGLRLLAMDALGGSGSRGYGRIRFEFDDSEIKDAYEKAIPLEPTTAG